MKNLSTTERRSFLSAAAAAVVARFGAAAPVEEPAPFRADPVDYASDVKATPANEQAVICGWVFTHLLSRALDAHDAKAGGDCSCLFCYDGKHACHYLTLHVGSLDGMLLHSDALEVAEDEGRGGPPIPDHLPVGEQAMLAGVRFVLALETVERQHGLDCRCDFCCDTYHLQWAANGWLDLMGGELPTSPERYALETPEHPERLEIIRYIWNERRTA